MATRKKKTEEQVIVEVSKLIAEETLQATESSKKKKVKETEVWPKVIKGSHSVRTEYEDGRVEFVSDWEALKKDVQNALTEYENSVKVTATKQKRKSKNEA